MQRLAYEGHGIGVGDGTMAGGSAIGELNGDGSLDLFVAIYGQGGPNQVWLGATESK